MLTRKSLQIASEIGVSAKVFTASWTWWPPFFLSAQARLRMRAHQGQISLAENRTKAAAFPSEIQQRTGDLGVDVVYSADQTPLFFEHIPTKTIAAEGTQTVWVRSAGKTKKRVTCMLLGDSFGNKYNPFLICKTMTPVKKETEN
uniref:Uncharacterized protein AlNc14C11G1377 n=1 Tax=Albugo laibachii Nc14 TaxID=890382 RepID=F0W2Z8_9STRA|nr:hypothetical protein PITG_06294 [Albugo laibachii Nc14]|eukprot:CCA15435.1 hypothetical protein PITG_06294 [Albugo laibachii Nc14]